MTIEDLIQPFLASVTSGQVEVYNEFSLQHELGLFLRQQFPHAKVQFERNVRHFFPDKATFVKREIDLVVYSPETGDLSFAIELKYPRNGQHPEQMFSFCKDIAFAEQLQAAGFAYTALLIFAEDPLFYRGSSAGIYNYFRGGGILNGVVQKPTGKRDETVTLCGTYTIVWKPIVEPLRYAIIEPTR